MNRALRRVRLAVVGSALLVMLLAVTGVVVQVTINDSLGHSLIGGGVLGAVVLSAFRLRRTNWPGRPVKTTPCRRAPDHSDVNDDSASSTF